MEQLSAKNQVHAHEILNLLLEVPRALPQGELQEQLEDRFGVGVRFTNCFGDIYDFDQIIPFLASQGKIVLSPDGITVCREEIGDHD